MENQTQYPSTDSGQVDPLCQSCGIPMVAPGIKGSSADGSENQDYCRFCFKEGKFLEPNMIEEQMIEKTANIMAQKSQLQITQARSMIQKSIPKLKRWREARENKSDDTQIELE